VTDTNGESWTASDDASWTYDRDFVCSSNPADYSDGYYKYDHTNTATIVETGQSDDAKVTVNCYAPVPSKDASTSYTRQYDWTITKDYDGTFHMFIGDPAESHGYKVTVDQTISEYDFAVDGTITLENPHPTEGLTVSLSDFVDGVEATLDCGGTLYVPADGSATCGYSAGLGSKTDGTNTATATFNGIDFVATADYTFGDPTTIVGEPDINVTDTNGESWTASDDASWTYDRDFACSSNPADYSDGYYKYDHTNTATIVETGQSDDAKVTVNCYAPDISKDANGTFDRDWSWEIEKVSDVTTLEMWYEDSIPVNYAVTLTPSKTDTNFDVGGTITVNNPNPEDTLVVVLTDVLGDGTPGVIDPTSCNYDAGTGELTVAPSGTETCDYTAEDLPYDDVALATTSNKATIDLNGILFEHTVNFSWSLVTETDECVDVSDDNGTPGDTSDDVDLGTVCADDADKTLEYTLFIGPFTPPDDCGEKGFVNTASFLTADSGTKGSSSWEILLDIICDEGCTLTQGYWKTHSMMGTAPYDPAWMNLGPDGENTPFFGTGLSWVEVLFQNPAGGNAYFILAHQYIAAELNRLNGASVSDLGGALGDAEFYLVEYEDVMDIPDDIREDVIVLASLLDDFNNGLIGPGYCEVP
jgi:hypothetical protein